MGAVRDARFRPSLCENYFVIAKGLKNEHESDFF